MFSLSLSFSSVCRTTTDKVDYNVAIGEIRGRIAELLKRGSEKGTLLRMKKEV